MSKEDFPITIRSARPGDVIVTAGGTKRFRDCLLTIKFLKVSGILGQLLKIAKE